MFEESHLGHRKFWPSEFEDVVGVAVVVTVALLAAVAEAEREVEGEESRIEQVLLMEILVSPAAAKSPDTPNSSWIIFFSFSFRGIRFKNNPKTKEKKKRKEKQSKAKQRDMEVVSSFLVSGEKEIKKVGFLVG